MATLRMLAFKCEVESSEIGDDSPYFVFFIGKASNPGAAQIVTLRQPHWDNEVSSGDVFKPNTAVASGIDSNTLVLCALIEEDHDDDIVDFIDDVRDEMQTVFKAFAAGASSSLSQMASQLVPEFEKSLARNIINDDPLGVLHIPTNINLTQHGSFAFHSLEAKYRVWFDII